MIFRYKQTHRQTLIIIYISSFLVYFMQPTRETSRQADRLTDRDRRRGSDQALPCLTISLRQLGLPLISIPIVSYCSHQQFLDWLNLFGLRGCLHLPCSPTPSSPSLSTEAGYGEVAVRALASVCACGGSSQPSSRKGASMWGGTEFSEKFNLTLNIHISSWV